ncbi:endothelial lipase-like [Planococcus citri]|uniref:endothelial lipase-like n=1 Tax=Planococcus citri TaxID=170843 RepID=UPI0031F872B7
MFVHLAAILFIMIRPSIEHCPDPATDCCSDKIKFFLYTNAEKPPKELILDEPKTIKDVKFNKGDFKFMIHGFTQWKNSLGWLVLREEYFKQKDKNWNIIFVDYSPVARRGCYWESAVPSLEQVGECGAELLRLIFKEKKEVKLDRFHFIGFSLGAQVCAQIANCLRPDKMKISRITGCDPALPGFSLPVRNSDTLLNKKHADFVDVIHTNKGMCGVLYSSAHYDIYAENGFCQPGCDFDDPSCSHDRALSIFAESVNSKTKFFARKCKSKVLLISVSKCNGSHKATLEVGEHCPRPKSDEEGLYHFRTNDKPPYAKGPPES